MFIKWFNLTGWYHFDNIYTGPLHVIFSNVWQSSAYIYGEIRLLFLIRQTQYNYFSLKQTFKVLLSLHEGGF